MKPMVLKKDAVVGADGAVVAGVARGNLIGAGAGWLDLARGGRLVAWSGWMGEGDGEREVWERDFATWAAAGWGALGEVCDRLVPVLRERGLELCLRPHARHVLCDPQRCLTFLRAREGQPIRLLLEPAAFLTGSMVARAEEHLDRAMAALAGNTGVWAVLLSNVRRVDEDAMELVRLGEGVLDAGMMVGVWKRYGGRVVVREGEEVEEKTFQI